MRPRSKPFLALALSLAAGTAAAQTVTAPVVEAPSGSGAVGASVTGAGASPMSAPSMSPGLTASPGLGSVVPSAPTPTLNAGANIPAGAAGVNAGAPSLNAAAAPSITAAGVPTASIRNPAATPATTGAPNAAPALTSGEHAPALSGPHGAEAAPGTAKNSAASPAAGAALEGTAKKLGDARLADGGEIGGLSVSRALDRAFDASIGAANLRVSPGAQGKFQDVRGAIAQKVSIANTASPADAPGLYQDAIQTAKEKLPAPAATSVASVVRSFAARKADVSLGELATAVFTAAAAGSKAETSRLLTSFDKWEALLGSQNRPLITNARDMKSSANALLDGAISGQGHSAPHVWLAKKDGSFTAVLPGGASSVAAVPALAASFAISPSALAPETALSDAYRAFSADPRAATGAGLVYRARRTLGSSVPGALMSASRFWLRSALESLWQRLVALFKGAPAYVLSQKSGQDALRRDAALVASAREGAASSRRRLADARLTVAGTRAAFADLSRAAESYRALSGDGSAVAEAESLRQAFESAVAGRGLRPGDAVPGGLEPLISGPLSYWSERIDAAASAFVAARFAGAKGASDFVNLGAAGGVAAVAAAEAKAAAGTPLSIVTLDDRYWARGRGSNGEARLSAELRPTASGGGVSLYVERADAALSRRLENMGLTVFPDGSGLRAVVAPEDFARGPQELGLLASRALSAALGRLPDESAGVALRALASETKRDPATAAELAALLDGREAFARAPVIGWVGDYEALAPTTVSVDGKPLLVSALRDPDTGLLAYARAARPDGAPLGAAETRSLLRAK